MKRWLPLVATALVLLPTPAAYAAGVGGVELKPETGSSFRLDVGEDETASATFTLTNITDDPATVQLYGASATRKSDGTWIVDSAGTADWLKLETQDVTLGGRETQEFAFDVVGLGEDVNGAIVLEQMQGNVAQRAATLVYVEAAGPISLPLLIVVAAVVLLALAGASVAVAARRRRAEDPVDEPAAAA